MTSRQRIMTALRGGEPDRIPFVPLVGRYYVRSLEVMGYNLEEIAPSRKATTRALKESLNLAEIEVLRLVHADIMRRHVIGYKLEYPGCRPLHSTDGEEVHEGWETPVGEIYESRRMTHGTKYITRHMLKNPEDINSFLYLIQCARAEPFSRDFAEFEAYIGDDGINTLTGPVTPIQEMLQFRMGIETTTYALSDYAEEMKLLFNAIQQLNRHLYTILADLPAEVVITYEDTSTTVMGPDWYRRYCMDELDQYSDILHGSDKLHIVHMCGKIAGLTDLIAEGTMDGIDSVCPPATGDLEPGDALERIGKTIIGGLEPAALVRMSAQECRNYAREKLNQTGTGRQFLLSTGDSTAAGTPVKNLQAISRLVAEKGSFPLSEGGRV